MSLFHEASTPLTGVAEKASVVLNNVPCDPTVIVTDAVRMSGGIAIKALADSITNSNIIGVVEAKITSILCRVRVAGVTPEIFAGLDETKEYYLSDSTAGVIVEEGSAPTAAGSVLVRIGQPFSSTRMFVTKGIRIIRS